MREKEELEIVDANAKMAVVPQFHVDKPYFLCDRAAFAMSLLNHSAIAAKPGKPGKTYQPNEFYPIEEIVTRACDIADATYTEFERRGWVVPVPTRQEAINLLAGSEQPAVGFSGRK